MNKEEIQQFIDDHAICFGGVCDILEDEKGLYVDVHGGVFLNNFDLSIWKKFDNELPFRFGTVAGSFNISSSHLLKSLNGCPKKVHNDFNCSFNDSITSLEGGPEDVGGNYIIAICMNLKSLVGLPKIMHGGDIDVRDNDNNVKDYLTILKTKGVGSVNCDNKGIKEIINRHLKSRDIMQAQEELIDAGLEIYSRLSTSKVKVTEAIKNDVEPWMLELEKAQHALDSFGVENHSVIWDNKRNIPVANVNGSVNLESTSFIEIPIKFGHVTGDFKLNRNPKLETLKNAPDVLDGDLECIGCLSLRSLEGSPKKVKNLNVNTTSIKNFIGGPEEVEEYFSFTDCKLLESLEGGPKRVGNSVMGSDCEKLKSLVGSPDYVKEDFCIPGCSMLKTTEGITPNIGKDLRLDGCDELEKFIGIKSINGSLSFYGCEKITNILAVLRIKGILTFGISSDEVRAIIIRHYKDGDIMSCQDELIEAGFKHMANLK
jgi:hypothetical protein